MRGEHVDGGRPGPIQGWPEADYDAALHLLDRQVVTADGRLVGKVDDMELTVQDGVLVPTGLLVGLGALLPRFGTRLGPWLHDRYRQISLSHADRRAPSVIDLDLVEDIGSAVHLTQDRDALLRPRVEHVIAPVRHRLGELLSMRVVPDPSRRTEAWPRRPRVLDVRLAARPDQPGRHAVDALVVGGGHPGGLLGYDRGQVNRPWPVAALVGRLHRRSVLVFWGRGVEVDWEVGEVRVGEAAEVAPLVEKGTGPGQDAE